MQVTWQMYWKVWWRLPWAHFYGEDSFGRTFMYFGVGPLQFQVSY